MFRIFQRWRLHPNAWSVGRRSLPCSAAIVISIARPENLQEGSCRKLRNSEKFIREILHTIKKLESATGLMLKLSISSARVLIRKTENLFLLTCQNYCTFR